MWPLASRVNIAFSTIACPEWTLPRVARFAAESGYRGVELRTFGHASSTLACDPALTAASKVRGIFKDHGVEICCLATGVSFDEPVSPPLIGRVISDNDRSIRLAKSAIDLATQIECPMVRVFGFQLPDSESVKAGTARVIERIALAADGARNVGVTVALENGGSFPTAASVRSILDDVASPMLKAAYSVPAAWLEGESPEQGLRTLASDVLIVKLRDRRPAAANQKHRFCLPGEGEIPCQAAVRELAQSGSRAWISIEWDRLWMPELDAPERVLPEAARRVLSWAAAPVHAGAR